jgi:hypothetical protein
MNTILEKLNNNIKYLSIVSTSLGLYAFMNNKTLNKVNNELINERNRFNELNNKYQDLLKDKLTESEIEKIISNEKMKNLVEEMNKLKSKLSNKTSINENVENSNTILDELTDINQTFKNSNNQLNSYVEVIEKYVNSKNNNNFTDSFMNLIHDLNNIINSMTLEQNLAFINISASFFILFSMFSILFIFYGDYLIIKLNLETKFPRLAKLIQLRRKFQHFYILLDITISIIFLLLIIYLNITFYF